jgi:hypothetical protein
MTATGPPSALAAIPGGAGTRARDARILETHRAQRLSPFVLVIAHAAKLTGSG